MNPNYMEHKFPQIKVRLCCACLARGALIVAAPPAII
mgnify:FL=1